MSRTWWVALSKTFREINKKGTFAFRCGVASIHGSQSCSKALEPQIASESFLRASWEPPGATHVSYEFTLFYRNLKNWFVLKKLYVDGKYQVEIKKVMKPKMVPMVHRNILYRMDFKLSDSTVEFLMKTQNWHFKNGAQQVRILVLGLKMGSLRRVSRWKLFLSIFWAIPTPSRLNFHIYKSDFQ